jgi:putative YphP/YqiW family bacilliredoxin
MALGATENAPDHLTTVFAGQDTDATERARSYIVGYPPSSPSIALFKDGEVVYMMERWQIESRAADVIARDLVAAFDQHCGPTASA